MRGQPGFFDIDDRLKRLSHLGDHQLEAFRFGSGFRAVSAGIKCGAQLHGPDDRARFREGNILTLEWLGDEEPRAVGDPFARGDVLCAEPGRSHSRPETCAGPARESEKLTPGMHVDEKSDEVVVCAG